MDRIQGSQACGLDRLGEPHNLVIYWQKPKSCEGLLSSLAQNLKLAG